MGTNLMDAHRQWAERADDERFETLEELIQATTYHRQCAVETPKFNLQSVLFEHSDTGEEVEIVSPTGNRGQFTHYAFDQMARRVGAPPNYLRKLDARVAAVCLNNGIRNLDEDSSTANLLWHRNGGLKLRAALSDTYSRIHNNTVAEAVRDRFSGNGWRVPPARPATANATRQRKATAADVILQEEIGGAIIREGDIISPAGLFASDHDLFILMVNPEHRIQDGSEYGLMPGFFVENSEVGAAALSVTTFYLRSVCGNLIIWNAEDVKRHRVVHRGSNDINKFYAHQDAINNFIGVQASTVESRINKLSTVEIGKTASEIAGILPIKVRGLSSSLVSEAYIECERTENCNPRSPYGIAQGLTRLSQNTGYMDNRVGADVLAGKVLEAYDF